MPMNLRVAAVLAALAVTSPALADDAACIQSYEATQTLRKATKLKDARVEAQKCSDAACPAILVKDCQKWLSELDEQLPSVVVEVKGAAGEPITNAKITLDGQPVVDAAPVVVEAGSHKVHVESADGKSAPVEQTVVVKEGEHAKKISVTLGSAKPPAEGRPVPIGALAFGGAGVVALGVGTVFAILGSSAESDLDRCKPACAASDVNAVSTKYAVADILFSAGVVSLVAAAYMFITRPNAVSQAASRRRFALEF